MTNRARTTVATVAFMICTSQASASDPTARCDAKKHRVAGSYASCIHKAEKRARLRNEPANLATCKDKFLSRWQTAETNSNQSCSSLANESAVETMISQCHARITQAVTNDRGAMKSCVLDPSGLNPQVYQCGDWWVGEEVSTQLAADGILFESNDFAIVHASTHALGHGAQFDPGEPIRIAVNTVRADGCPEVRNGDNGIATMRFVHNSCAAQVVVHKIEMTISDTERSVHVRTLNPGGQVMDECNNVFQGCAYTTEILDDHTVRVSFTGGGIERIELIDQDTAGWADGFQVHDIKYHGGNICNGPNF